MTMEHSTMSDAARIAVLSDSPATGSLVRDVVATTLPGVTSRTLDPGDTALDLDRTDCIVIDATVRGEPGMSLLRRVRAGGYAGGAVLLLDAATSAETGTDAAMLGARSIESATLVDTLGTAIVDAISERGGDASAAPARAALQRARRLMAAGEIALRMQHALNNPLAALLAEAQLLEMEQLTDEQHDAVTRIVEQLRRVIGVVRQLDGVGKARDGHPGDAKRPDEHNEAR
jgi:signal transduction histidine kinase